MRQAYFVQHDGPFGRLDFPPDEIVERAIARLTATIAANVHRVKRVILAFRRVLAFIVQPRPCRSEDRFFDF